MIIKQPRHFPHLVTSAAPSVAPDAWIEPIKGGDVAPVSGGRAPQAIQGEYR